MTIDDYFTWRKNWLAHTTGSLLDTPRGKCIVCDDIIIRDTVRPDWHMANRDIEDAEYNLIYNGMDMPSAMYSRLYDNDAELYEAYKSLKVCTLLTNGKRRASRKNIIFNRETCLCYFQLQGSRLIVISRSWDIQRAGLSDLYVVNRIAESLGCTHFVFYCLCPHVYVDRNHIARRNDK